MNGDLLERVNWIWGLSLVALTIAIHATGVVVLALVGFRIRVRIGNRRLGLRYVIPIVIGLVAAAGFLLALLHGIEAAIWAAAYLGWVRSTRLWMQFFIRWVRCPLAASRG